MKQKTANAHEEISEECHHENGIVAMFSATDNAGVGKVCEHQVGQGVDNLGSVRSSIVVLEDISIGLHFEIRGTQTSSHQFSVEVTGAQ